MQRKALVSGRSSLLDASGFDFSTCLLGEDGASGKWRHLGLSGASEKHSTSNGASGVMTSAAYDMECTRPLTVSISYITICNYES